MGAGVKTNLIFFERTGPTKEIWYGEVKGKFTKTKMMQDKDLEKMASLLKDKVNSDFSWTVKIEQLEKLGFDLSAKNPNSGKSEDSRNPREIIEIIREQNKKIDLITEELNKLL